jgi:uncharacterized surface protein with fasciclin (FAS1) repeats
MAKSKQLTLFTLLIILFIGCRDDQFDKYARPKWLQGKVYTQIKNQPELSTFAKCLELTGFDKIIDVSGSYTVFAPSNEAFNSYFKDNTKYKSVENIPIAELSSLVKYHIVQNPWSKIQLRSLDVYGWIDSLDVNNDKPRGFKRETLLLNKDFKVGVSADKKNNYLIVDTLASNWDRRIFTNSRKYAPIFYKEYFDIYNLNTSDYPFYFNRPFENSQDIYYVNSKIIGDEIAAENGFIYNVDHVVEPLKNAYEILNAKENSYSEFLKLINYFPNFSFNENETNNQAGAKEGLAVDSLFDLTYPGLTFNISNERTKAPSGTFGLPNNVTIRYHYGLMAPTNDALKKFLDEYINGTKYWGDLENAPENIKKMIVNTYMSVNPIYKTDIDNGFYNGELDIVKLDESNIIQKQFGSNCSFIGLKKAIVPRAFSSITGPVYRQQKYSVVMYAIEKTRLLSALKRENQTYSLYIENDNNLLADSSLIYNSLKNEFFLFVTGPGGGVRKSVNTKDLRTLILNHVGIQQPKGIARKEFIKNMAGNYLVVNNETGVVSGMVPTTAGYNGVQQVNVIPVQISTNADNGTTYDISDWFRFSGVNLYSEISTQYPKFHQLLVNAGLAVPKEYRYNFISDNEFYTVFAPTDKALDNYNVGGLTKDELKNFLLMHFVQGEIIFTDGNKPSGYYETARIDEKSTSFSTINTKIYIKTGIDQIDLPGKTGGNYLTINESGKSNIFIVRSLGDGSEVFPAVVTNAVIHQIDKVLLFNELDTK